MIKLKSGDIKEIRQGGDWDLAFEGKIYKTVKAKDLYNKMTDNAFMHNEPGIFNVDHVNEYNNGHWAFDINEVNPCFTGDTLVAVADGRNAVRFDQLAKEKKDVPVYAKDESGKTIIKTMRNPRITGYNKKLLKITLDDGSEIKCTPNHKISMRDGSHKEAKDLIVNDSLYIRSKWKTSLKELYGQDEKNSQDYWMINDGIKNQFEHRFIYEQLNNINIEKNHIIHHKDFNGTNNFIENLELMNRKAHDIYHGKRMRGDNNPYHGMSDLWKKNFASKPGETNSKYCGYTNEELLNIMTNWVEENNKPITSIIWSKLASDNGYPQHFNSYRGNLINYFMKANIKGGQKWFKSKYDRREYNRYLQLLEESDLELIFKNSHIYVTKKCEECNCDIVLLYGKREICYCPSCSKKIRISKMSTTVKNNTFTKRAKNRSLVLDTFSKYINKNKILPNSSDIHKIINDLGFNDFKSVGYNGYRDFLNKIKTDYNIEEFNTQLISRNKSYRELKANELIDNGMIYNHKVISIEEFGFDTVYNGTVDDVHNFNVIVNKDKTFSNKEKYIMINTPQCGEVPMPRYSICCLSALNLGAFVKNKFQDDAYFDFEDFAETAKWGVRFLDDVLSIAKYPLQKIEDNALGWRRIGLGFTALGNVFQYMKIAYGSDASKELSKKIAKTMRDSSYRASAELAGEKGKFPFYDEQLNNAKFIKQLPKDLRELIRTKGMRNIALNTIAPTGCLTKDSKVKTVNGIKSFKELFEENMISLRDEIESINKWFVPIKDIFVETLDGSKRVTKYYINGKDDIVRLSTENNKKINGTKKHKILVKVDDNRAVWKRLDEIRVGEKILIKK